MLRLAPSAVVATRLSLPVGVRDTSLASTSASCYASIHTGVPPQVHGVWGNAHVRRLDMPDLFSALAQAGRRTGAVTHSFWSEFFQRAPFDAVVVSVDPSLVPGTVLVPGHDLSMRLDGAGRPVYLGERKAAIAAWFAESIHTMTTIDLCAGQGAFGAAYRSDSQS